MRDTKSEEGAGPAPILVLAVLVVVGVLTPMTVGPSFAESEALDGEGSVVLNVGVEPNVAPEALASLVDAVGGEVEGVNDAIDVMFVSVSASGASSLGRLLAGHPVVTYVEQASPYHAAFAPDDPFFEQQWGLRHTRFTEAWGLTLGSSDVVVAVLDTGVDPDHPDLQGALTAGWDFVNGGNQPWDDHGHGTAVAGVVAARINNGVGIAGACGRCTIMPIKVLDHAGVTPGNTDRTVVDGITWATDHGATVINLSLASSTTGTGSEALQDAVRYAQERGVLVVAAAGNDGRTEPVPPASIEGVLGVAGSDEDDRLGKGGGKTSNNGPWVEVTAPWCTVSTWSTVSVLEPGEYVQNFCGTSAAAPVVSGLAGLVLARHRGLSAEVVKGAITASAVPVGDWVAYGRVDAADALDALEQVVRVAGSDRIATAVAVSREAFDNAPTVVLARHNGYADALAAAPLAAKLGGPILLTPTSTLPPAVRTEITRLGATKAVIVGGRAAVDGRVVAALWSMGLDVERIAGEDRFDTAARIAGEVGGTRVYVTEGANADPARGWPDAVAVSALAAFQQRPVLLATRDVLPPASRQALVDLGATHATMVGGPNAVGAGVHVGLEDPAGDGSQRVAVDRLHGSDRWTTSAAVVERSLAAGASPAHTWLATGLDWPDALAAGPAAAHRGGVLLLAHGADLTFSPPVLPFLRTHRAAVERGVVTGGGVALSTTVEIQAREAVVAP